MSEPTPAPTATSAATSVAELLAALARPDHPPFALLRRRTPGLPGAGEVVEVLTGPVREVERLAELPIGPLGSLALVPFRQIRERGFEVTDDGTPLSVLVAEEAHALPLDEVLAALPAHRPEVTGGGFDVSDAAYADTVARVIADEIGRGEGANFVIRRTYEGRIEGFDRSDALALFGRLLRGERGAYWTFVVHTGERTLVGAGPEVHVRASGGTVVMNPISGTLRHPASGPDAESLLAFLGDRKEIDELSMVVDEELKMMCAVGDLGGVVVGPRLREMAHVTHTEYELRGRSSLDVREVLRETMFAATVTGSPVENACRVIRRYESGGRGYYAGALALLGRDGEGRATLDSPILIRTADIAADGSLRVPVGATLVRHSDPASEVAETHAKAAGVLAALGVPAHPAALGSGGTAPAGARARWAEDPRVAAALAARRRDLAPFWLRLREPVGAPVGEVLLVDGEDTFTAMLAHVLRVAGSGVRILRHDDPGLGAAARAHRGPIVLGPGPGDPTAVGDPRLARLRELAGELVAGHRHGLLGVCLGHELIAEALGLPLVRKAEPAQGAQVTVDLFGRAETVGFYNTFTAVCEDAAAAGLAARGVEVARDARTGEVHALRSAGGGLAGVQFHPESVLTLRGAELVAELLALVTTGAARGAAKGVSPRRG
ncbi:anthranilate synthase family protein [Streptomyces sp. BI20]|uniref:anthranilate synthase family protein n=1 Tax=Streptomyces sp. BI20 TaxID=3403460 RepID=UPI003C7325D8